eukprot:GFUD01039504.1.p1 GENE.GFUD01039504.1~~GFUD01039504.1.p1  ORF type:complete len:185 (-),score=42.26 GFUD01039504.1:58-612(-)
MDARDVSSPESNSRWRTYRQPLPSTPDTPLQLPKVKLLTPSTPQSPLSVKKCPRTPQLKLLTPLKPTSPYLLSSRLHPLLSINFKSRCNSWQNLTPDCARGLEWDSVIDYRSPRTRHRWDNVSPLRGSPANRLFCWAFTFEEQLETVDLQDGEVDHDVFPLTDLDRDVTHDLTIKDYEYLPPTL